MSVITTCFYFPLPSVTGNQDRKQANKVFSSKKFLKINKAEQNTSRWGVPFHLEGNNLAWHESGGHLQGWVPPRLRKSFPHLVKTVLWIKGKFSE